MAAPSSPPASSPSNVLQPRGVATSIADRVAHAFTPHAMVQGFASHEKGVETVSSTVDRFFARVRSKRTHEVSLRADAGRLVIACSCPARSLGLKGCKHAWAALLEVDRSAGLGQLRDSTRSPLAVDMVGLECERPAPAKAKPVPPTKPGVAKAASARAPRAKTKAPRAETKAATKTPKQRASTRAKG